jgi:hypothetical protein
MVCGEFRVLGQKSVARMNRIDSRFARDAQDVRDIEVSVDRAAAEADQVGFVSLGSMQAEQILLRVDRDRPDIQFAGGTHDSYRDLAAIGDQQPMNPLQHANFSNRAAPARNFNAAGGRRRQQRSTGPDQLAR